MLVRQLCLGGILFPFECYDRLMESHKAAEIFKRMAVNLRNNLSSAAV